MSAELPEFIWRHSGWGGSAGSDSWQRLVGSAEFRRNGTQIGMWLRLPGNEAVTRIGLNFDATIAALARLQNHGDSTSVRIDIDVPIPIALRETKVQAG